MRVAPENQARGEALMAQVEPSIMGTLAAPPLYMASRTIGDKTYCKRMFFYCQCLAFHVSSQNIYICCTFYGEHNTGAARQWRERRAHRGQRCRGMAEAEAPARTSLLAVGEGSARDLDTWGGVDGPGPGINHGDTRATPLYMVSRTIGDKTYGKRMFFHSQCMAIYVSFQKIYICYTFYRKHNT